jgi:HK97 family phage prohead protease
MSAKEIRTFSLALEKREDASENRVLEGHAAVFNSRSGDLGGFVEVIQEGAFTDAIETGQDVRMLVGHDPDKIVARTKSGTLSLSEDDIGLHIRGDVAKTSVGNDLLVSVNRGDIDQMSFAFSVADDGVRWDFDREPAVRYITKADLFDVSPVTYPAYDATDISVAKRSMEQAKAELTPKAPEKQDRTQTDDENLAACQKKYTDLLTKVDLS